MSSKKILFSVKHPRSLRPHPLFYTLKPKQVLFIFWFVVLFEIKGNWGPTIFSGSLTKFIDSPFSSSLLENKTRKVQIGPSYYSYEFLFNNVRVSFDSKTELRDYGNNRNEFCYGFDSFLLVFDFESRMMSYIYIFIWDNHAFVKRINLVMIRSFWTTYFGTTKWLRENKHISGIGLFRTIKSILNFFIIEIFYEF